MQEVGLLNSLLRDCLEQMQACFIFYSLDCCCRKSISSSPHCRSWWRPRENFLKRQWRLIPSPERWDCSALNCQSLKQALNLKSKITLLCSSLRGESLDTEESSFQCAAIGWQVMDNWLQRNLFHSCEGMRPGSQVKHRWQVNIALVWAVVLVGMNF